MHDLPGVGENLHDHLQIRMVCKVKNVGTLNERANSLFGKAAMGLEYLLFKTGPLTMPPSQLGAFAKSDPSQPSANIEWHVQPLSLDKFGDAAASPFRRSRRRCATCGPPAAATCASRAPTRTRTRRSRSTTSPPRRTARSRCDSMRFTRRIMAAQALAKYQPEELQARARRRRPTPS